MLIVNDGDSYCFTSAYRLFNCAYIGVCPALQNPINGQIFMHGNMAAFVVCFNGTTVNGNPILICNNGNWNSPPPTCRFLNS